MKLEGEISCSPQAYARGDSFDMRKCRLCRPSGCDCDHLGGSLTAFECNFTHMKAMVTFCVKILTKFLIPFCFRGAGGIGSRELRSHLKIIL